MLLRRPARPSVWEGRNDQETTGHGDATFSSQGASEMASIWNRRPSVISRSSSTTNSVEDGAEATLIGLVGSRVTTPA
jgi:hypothetical protein